MKIDDPKIEAKVEFDAAGGENCKVIIPREWLKKLGITPEQRNVTLAFDGQRVMLAPKGCSYASRIERIHTFALVWRQLFKLHDYLSHYYFYSFMGFAQSMEELGFASDECYRHAKGSNDIDELGHIIYSAWQNFHSSSNPLELEYKDENFDWFTDAFTRLAELSADPKSVINEKEEVARYDLWFGKNAKQPAED